MHHPVKSVAILATIVASFAALPSFAHNVNKSIQIPEGSQSSGESTVNGSVSIGANSTVTGDVDTVNGGITIESGSQVEDASTVNGGISIGSNVVLEDVTSVNGSVQIAENVTVDGEVSAVNGRIELGDGTKVADIVSNVNGPISAVGAEIGGNLETVTGDVTLTDGAVLHGDLVVEKPRRTWRFRKNRRKPVVTIGPDSRVVGEIVLKQEVELYISDTATVGGVTGEMEFDDAVRFSGARP